MAFLVGWGMLMHHIKKITFFSFLCAVASFLTHLESHSWSSELFFHQKPWLLPFLYFCSTCSVKTQTCFEATTLLPQCPARETYRSCQVGTTTRCIISKLHCVFRIDSQSFFFLYFSFSSTQNHHSPQVPFNLRWQFCLLFHPEELEAIKHDRPQPLIISRNVFIIKLCVYSFIDIIIYIFPYLYLFCSQRSFFFVHSHRIRCPLMSFFLIYLSIFTHAEISLISLLHPYTDFLID